MKQLRKKLNQNEESERKVNAEEQEDEEEEDGDLEEEELHKYSDEETDAETIEEEPDFSCGSNYELASESEEDGDPGYSDSDEVCQSTR